jgi:hypothetical protein
MKTKYRTILMFIIVFTGITLCYSQGLTENSTTLSFSPKKVIITCPEHDEAAAQSIEVNFIYNEEKGELEKLTAEDLTDQKTTLYARELNEAYIVMKGTKPDTIRVGTLKRSGPPGGSWGCTEKNLPYIIVGPRVWFIYKK